MVATQPLVTSSPRQFPEKIEQNGQAFSRKLSGPPAGGLWISGNCSSRTHEIRENRGNNAGTRGVVMSYEGGGIPRPILGQSLDNTSSVNENTNHAVQGTTASEWF